MFFHSQDQFPDDANRRSSLTIGVARLRIKKVIGTDVISMQPDVLLPSGGRCVFLLSWLFFMAFLPVSALAEAGPEAGPSAVSAGLDGVTVPESELRSQLDDVRSELRDNLRALHQLEFQLQQSGRAQELVAEIKPIRRALGELYDQLDQVPERTDELDPQVQALRRELNEKEAQLLGQMNQSEDYRALSSRAAELREQLKSILLALPSSQTEDNAEKP